MFIIISVTIFIKSLFEEFNTKEIINDIIKKNDPKGKYYLKTMDEIKSLWENNAKDVSSLGTQNAYTYWNYYNNIELYDKDCIKTIEIQQFHQFVDDNPHLIPYRTEWTIYDKKYEICGGIDMVFFNNKTQKYDIYDWKRVRKIEYISFMNNTAIEPCIDYKLDL